MGATPVEHGKWTVHLGALVLALVVFALLSLVPVGVAQEVGKVYKLGLLGTTSPSAAGHLLEAFRQRMRELGWREGQNFVLEARWAEGRMDRLHGIAAELAGLKVDIIFAASNTAVVAAKHATTTIPIVMVANDPIGSGFVKSLARPGGNITGLSYDVTPETFGKNIELLKEVVPTISHAAVLLDPTFPGAQAYWKATEDSARQLGVSLQSVEARRADDVETAFAAIIRQPAGGGVVFPGGVNFIARSQIAALAAKHRLPTIAPLREWADAGSLMSYGVSFTDLVRRATDYVDRILRGAKPDDLPVEQPTKLELIVNLKIAKALGVTIPQSLLLRADHLIE